MWDKKRKSKYIDSLLRGLPTPNLFLYENKKEDQLYTDSKLIVVDGFQRITAIDEFLKGELTLMKTSSISEKWAGKTYLNLDPSYKNKFKYTSIPITYFYQNKPNSKSSISLIFERINTGSVQLTAQEIREAIFFSPFIEQVREFDKNSKWLKLMVKNYELEQNKDSEIYAELTRKNPKALSDRKTLILRYFMLRDDYKRIKKEGKSSSGSLDKRLENTCKFYSVLNLQEGAAELEKLNKVIGLILENFGENVFYTPKEDEGISFSIHPTIFDSLVVSVSEGIDRGLTLKSFDLEKSFRDILYEEYEDIELNPFRKRTLSQNSIENRVDKIIELIHE